MATQVADETTVTGFANPMGTDGFEFVEYTAPDIELLRSLFTKMGFPEVARHKSKNVTLHKQADCNFIINAEPGSYAEEYAKAHGPSACAMAFRVKDAKAAFDRAVKLGATPAKTDVAHGEMDIPAIEGIGGSLLFFVDQYGDNGSIYDVAVNVGSATQDDVHTTTRELDLPVWSEGWHTGALVLEDYVSLGVHSTDIPLGTHTQNIADVMADLTNVNHISIYGIGYGPDGAHLIHRNGGGHDGLLVTEPLSVPAHARLFSFSTLSF
jgi:hypothetical protein